VGEAVTLSVSSEVCVTVTGVEKTGVHVCPMLVHVMDMGNVCARIGLPLVKTSNTIGKAATPQFFDDDARTRLTGIHIFAP